MTAIYRVLLEPVQAGRPQPYLTGDTFEGSESVNEILVKLGILELVESLGISQNEPKLEPSPFKPVSEPEIKDILAKAETDLKATLEQTAESANVLETELDPVLETKKPAVEPESELIVVPAEHEPKQRRRREVQS